MRRERAVWLVKRINKKEIGQMLAFLKSELILHITTQKDSVQIANDLVNRLDLNIRSALRTCNRQQGHEDNKESNGSEEISMERLLRKELHSQVAILASGLSMSSVDEQHDLFCGGSTGWNVEDVVAWCKAKKEANLAVFESITSHHLALKDAAVNKSKSWDDALLDSAAGLNAYADAAKVMGAKTWVVEGHKWSELIAEHYFFGDLAKKTYVNSHKYATCRRADGRMDKEKLTTLQDSFVAPSVRSDHKLNLLDIGSCFNPHGKGSKCHRFEVVALDLVPQDDSVLSCDFIRVNVGDELSMKDGHLESLPRNFFHVVTLSLVLCYLPTPKEREAVTRKARECLVSEKDFSVGGLLLISEKGSIFSTSDSGSYLKTWKAAMRGIGFAFVRYETKIIDGSKRLHLFAFRRIEEFEEDPRFGLVIKSDFAKRRGSSN